MQGFWAGIWRSGPRSIGVGLLLSVAIASTLYAFNWHTFYDTRGHYFESQAEQIAADIDGLRAATSDDAAFRAALAPYLARRRPDVAVVRTQGGATQWREGNDAEVDRDRTLVERRFVLAGDPPGDSLYVDVRRSNRPPLATALVRAWTFSLGDYLREPEAWWARHWYNRSVPLYGYLVTVMLVGLGTIRSLHRNQKELDRLHGEADEVEERLEQVRARSAEQIDAVRERARETERQRDEAIRVREELQREIDAVENESRALEHTRESGGVEVSDERLRSIAERRARAQTKLADHEDAVALVEDELATTRDELGAAEQLLEEVEVRQEELQSKLRDRNRRIRQLQELVQKTRNDTHRIELDAARTFRSPAGDAVAALEDQVEPWLVNEGAAQVGFSSHSRTVKVEKQFEKIDRAFVDRFFTHVVNPEYERGARRLIRVVAAPESRAGEQSGQLIVSLDDDAGRTLGFRYATRPGAPGGAHVGFVLALLLRSRCRDFRHFDIRIR